MIKIGSDSVLFIIICISTGGERVKISIGNIGSMVVGDNAGGIGVGKNCNVNSES